MKTELMTNVITYSQFTLVFIRFDFLELWFSVDVCLLFRFVGLSGPVYLLNERFLSVNLVFSNSFLFLIPSSRHTEFPISQVILSYDFLNKKDVATVKYILYYYTTSQSSDFIE